MYQRIDGLRGLPVELAANQKHRLLAAQHLTVKGGFEDR